MIISKRVVLTEAQIIAVDSAILTEIGRLTKRVASCEPHGSKKASQAVRIIDALVAAQIALQLGR